MGKVGGDEVGNFFLGEMRDLGITIDVQPADAPTGTCAVLITEDAQRTMLTNLGASGIEFQVRVYVEEPEFRGRVVDTLNTRIYKGLMDAGVEIPFPQQDVRIKEWPGK